MVKTRHIAQLCMSLMTVLIGCAGHGLPPDQLTQRIDVIHRQFVFADIHAHPSRFHRANVPRISREELDLYQRSRIDVVVCNISADAPYAGGYTNPNGVYIPRKRPRGEFYDLEPGAAFAFATDRVARILRTITDGDAVLASSPQAVLSTRTEVLNHFLGNVP